MTVAAGTMKRTLVVFVLLATATAIAQDDKNPVTSVVKGILPRQQKNLVAAAEEMPMPIAASGEPVSIVTMNSAVAAKVKKLTARSTVARRP